MNGAKISKTAKSIAHYAKKENDLTLTLPEKYKKSRLQAASIYISVFF
jgi:hypothetical protein